MARISKLQLELDFPTAPSWTSDVLTQGEAWAEQILGGDTLDALDLARETAWLSGTAAQAGWAEIQRQVMALPAVGLPDSIPGLRDRMLELGSNWWGVGEQSTGMVWLATSGIGQAVGNILSSPEGIGAAFPAALAAYRDKMIGRAIGVVVGEAPIVGWLFQIAYSGISFLIRRQAALDELTSQQAVPAATGVSAILPPFGGVQSRNRARAFDMKLLREVRGILDDVSISVAGSGDSGDLDESARGSDLTRAFLPAFIPSGMATVDEGEPGDLLFASEDAVSLPGEKSIPGLRVFASRPARLGDSLGVGYIPGLRRIMGWDSIIDLEGQPRTYTDPLSSTTQALSQLEYQCLRPPWCYMIDVDAIEAIWSSALSGWVELKTRLYYRMRGGISGMDVFRPSSMIPRIQEPVVRSADPGWWINASRICRTMPGGGLEERIIPGPPMCPRSKFEPVGMQHPDGYVMGPLDYFAGVEYFGLYDAEPGSAAAADIAERGTSVVRDMDDPWGPDSQYVDSFRKVYRPGEYGSWGEPYSPGMSPGKLVWPMVPEGQTVEWDDPIGEVSCPGTTVQTGSVLDIAIRPWLEKVRAAQLHYLGTHWCAYVHPGMPAFRSNPGLRFVLAGRFAQLLKSPSRFELHTEDVMDDAGPGSRKEMLQNAGVCFPGKFVGCGKLAPPPAGKITISGFIAQPTVPDVDPEDPPEPIPPVDLPPPVPGGDETPPGEPDPVLEPEPPEGSPWPWAVAAAAVGYAASKGKGRG